MALDLRMSTEGRSGTSVCFVDDCCVETRTVVPVPMKFEELKESVKEELRLTRQGAVGHTPVHIPVALDGARGETAVHIAGL